MLMHELRLQVVFMFCASARVHSSRISLIKSFEKALHPASRDVPFCCKIFSTQVGPTAQKRGFSGHRALHATFRSTSHFSSWLSDLWPMGRQVTCFRAVQTVMELCDVLNTLQPLSHRIGDERLSLSLDSTHLAWHASVASTHTPRLSKLESDEIAW